MDDERARIGRRYPKTPPARSRGPLLLQIRRAGGWSEPLSLP